MRQLAQLELVRDRSPLFSLTWTVMHEIDEESPFRCLLDSGVEDTLVAVTATLIGHDGTYGQTVYSRKIWQPEDVLVGYRFADILSQLPDGRLMVDYSSFQELVEEAGAAPGQSRSQRWFGRTVGRWFAKLNRGSCPCWF